MTRHDTLDRLDDRALRDLGLDRSELSSLRAECDGTAPPTRRRVVRLASEVAATRAHQRARQSVGTTLAWIRRLVTVAAAVIAAAAASAVVRGTRHATDAVAAPPCCVGGPQRGSAADATYFPSQFAPPSGEIEPLPSQF